MVNIKFKNENIRQIVLFVLFSSLAAISQFGSRLILDLLLSGYHQTVEIWPFGKQAIGSFIAFLVSNIIAKVVSYVTNRKTTFKANNNALASAVIYFIMVVVLIIVETIIGTPIQNWLYKLLGGTYTGAELVTDSVNNATLYQICGIGSQAIYSFFDGIIVFLMDKYVIMRRK